MDIRAPYTFVPVSTRVNRVSRPRKSGWEDAPSQDHPYEDGVCGEVRVRLTAETPLFIRGTTNRQASFQDGDGQYAIPGSSVRGLIRSVVEIASFSALGPVNDVRHGFRDLQNRTLYGDHMAGLHKGEPMPFVSAAWLVRTAGSAGRKLAPGDQVAELRVCNFAKVEYSFLESRWKHPRLRIGDRAPAPHRYEAYGVSPGGELPAITVPVRILREHDELVQASDGRQRRVVGAFGKSDPQATRVTGRLVVTGQPNNFVRGALKNRGAGNPKHHDFVFFGDTLRTLPVLQRDLDAFEFVHRAEQEQHGLRVAPNPEWAFWRGAFDAGRPVPAFVLTRDDGKLRAFGLAMMFRLAYDRTIGDAVRNAQPESGDDRSRLDYAQALFGHVEKEGDAALKGRVSFGSLVAKGKPVPMPEVEAVLGTPKATFYPNYMENGQLDEAARGALPAGGSPNGQYATLMDAGARVRGWKRYRPQDADLKPVLPDKASDRVRTRFAPLPAGTTFEGVIRVHNVRMHELGALLWAVSLPSDPPARHTVGMAKSLGFGRARIEVVSTDVERNDAAAFVEDDAVAAFQAHMEAWAQKEGIPGGWALSLPVQSLIAAARPLPPGVRESHLQLKNAAGKNEFVAAKQARATLRPALAHDEWAKLLADHGLTAPSVRTTRAPLPAPARPAGFGIARPAPPPVVAVPQQPSDDPSVQLKRAFLKGQQWALLREWAKEGSTSKTERLDAARALMGTDLEKKGAKYPEVMDWMRG